MQAAHGLGGRHDLLGLAQRRLGLELLHGLTQLLHLVGLLLHALQNAAGRGLEELGGLQQRGAAVAGLLQRHLAGGGLDTADAGGHAALGLDAEHTGLSGVVQMGTAAQLHGELAHGHHAHGLAVLLAEGSHGAPGLGLRQRQLLGGDGQAVQHRVVHQILHLQDLLGGDGLKVGKVEAQTIRLHQRAGLMDVVAQHLLQRGIQQVGGGVGAAHGAAALRIDGGGNAVAHMEGAPQQLAVVHILAALVLLDVGHHKLRAVGGDDAVVGHLTAHLGVERGLIQHHDGVHAADDLLHQLPIGHDGQHIGVVQLVILVAGKHGGGHILAELHAGPAQIAQRLAGLAGALLLLGHQGLEGRLVHGHALLGHHLRRQVDGEAEGIVQLEGVAAGKHRLALLLVSCQHLAVDTHTAVDGAGEILLLGADDLGDIALLLPQVGVLALVLMHHRVHHLIQERLVDAQQLAVAGGAAQQTAQHIAAALVAGQDAVADHECGGADVVGDDAQAHVPLLRLAVVGAGQLADLVGDVHNGIHIEQAVHVLAHAGQTLQTHTGVDVLLLQLGVVVVAVVVELAEHVVPDLDIAVAVAAHGAAGLAAAVLRAAVVVDLRAGAAGAGAVLPEVVLLAEAEDLLGGDADLIVPDVPRLVILQIDGGIQPVGLQTHPLRAGQELPAPRDGLVLEIVAEGEVAQHLKIGAVAGGLAHVLDIAGADALLAGADAAAGRLLLPLEPGLHRGHARVDEQDGFVVLGYQRKAGQAQMAFCLEELQEQLPQLIQAVIGMAHSTRLLYIVNLFHLQ